MRENTTSKLTSPIIYDGYSFEDKLQEAMSYFYDYFLRKDVKPQYKGRPIYFSMEKRHGIFTLTYPERFLHITSLDDEEKYNMYPCTNDPTYEICDNRCSGSSEYSNYTAIDRWECIYRLSRIHWIREVIDLANKGDRDITEWDVVEIDKKDKYNKRFIRYCHGMDDYVVILRARPKDYMFITAFPVVKKDKKAEYDSQYLRFIKK